MTHEELEELFAVREMFEAYAARIVAGRATAEDVAPMRELVAQMKASIARHDVARYIRNAAEAFRQRSGDAGPVAAVGRTSTTAAPVSRRNEPRAVKRATRVNTDGGRKR